MTDATQNTPTVSFSKPTDPFRLEETDTGLRLYAHGLFDSVESHTKLITELNLLSNKYNLIEVWVSGPGGAVSTLLEVLEALSQYDTVVTICNSSASSASAMLWSTGDVRVVNPLASFMWHRESYGFFGKTTQHEDLLEKQKKIFPILLDECSGDILTEEEMEKALYTEVYRTGQELIESDKAVSFSDYSENKRQFHGSRYEHVGHIVRDTTNGKTLCVDKNGDAETVGLMVVSPYSYPIFQHSVGNTRPIKQDIDGEIELTLVNDLEFEEFEDEFFAQTEGSPGQDDYSNHNDEEVQ